MNTRALEPGEAVVTLELSCALTNAELLGVGQRIADAMNARGDAQARMKAETAQLRKEIRDHDRLVGELQQMLATKKETRAVPCAVFLDAVRLTVRTVRGDTNEVIAERPMTDEERQAQLFPVAAPLPTPQLTEVPRRSRRSHRAA